MHKIICAALVSAIIVVAGSFSFVHAQELSVGKKRQAECSQEWKDKKAATGYIKPVKGEGRKAWNAFRSECTVRKGGKSKIAKG